MICSPADAASQAASDLACADASSFRAGTGASESPPPAAAAAARRASSAKPPGAYHLQKMDGAA